MMTKSVLVPSLSSGLHIQGSSCLLGPPQPPKTLATMHRTPLPHSQLPLTQHQGVSSTPLPPFPSLQSLNIRSPIIVYIEEPRCPVIICIERAGASTFSSFHRDCVALPPQAPGFVTECVCRSVVSDCLRPHGLQPARLLCPWDSPGMNTGVGCHGLLQGIFLILPGPTQGEG